GVAGRPSELYGVSNGHFTSNSGDSPGSRTAALLRPNATGCRKSRTDPGAARYGDRLEVSVQNGRAASADAPASASSDLSCSGIDSPGSASLSAGLLSCHHRA